MRFGSAAAGPQWITATGGMAGVVYKLAPLKISGVSSPRPTGGMWLRMAVHAAQHKIMNLRHYKIFL